MERPSETLQDVDSEEKTEDKPLIHAPMTEDGEE